MDSVAKFAHEAAAFERWLISGTDRGADAARECRIRLLELYRAGIELPTEGSDEIEERADVERVEDAEWRRAYEASGRLPLDYYSDVFDPTIVPGAAPAVGSLADDLADIYRDVVTGLRAYQRGDRAGAAGEWSGGIGRTGRTSQLPPDPQRTRFHPGAGRDDRVGRPLGRARRPAHRVRAHRLRARRKARQS